MVRLFVCRQNEEESEPVHDKACDKVNKYCVPLFFNILDGDGEKKSSLLYSNHFRIARDRAQLASKSYPKPTVYLWNYTIYSVC